MKEKLWKEFLGEEWFDPDKFSELVDSVAEENDVVYVYGDTIERWLKASEIDEDLHDLLIDTHNKQFRDLT